MNMAFFRFWRRRPTVPALLVLLYTRKGCHLCDVAWERLKTRQPLFRFRLESVDVDEDAELAARYGEEVPVVEFNGQVRFRGAVNEVLLDRLLQAEARQQRK